LTRTRKRTAPRAQPQDERPKHPPRHPFLIPLAYLASVRSFSAPQKLTSTPLLRLSFSSVHRAVTAPARTLTPSSTLLLRHKYLHPTMATTTSKPIPSQLRTKHPGVGKSFVAGRPTPPPQPSHRLPASTCEIPLAAKQACCVHKEKSSLR